MPMQVKPSTPQVSGGDLEAASQPHTSMNKTHGELTDPERSTAATLTKRYGAITFWFFCNIMLNNINKWIFKTYPAFKYPFLLTLCHTITSMLLTWVSFQFNPPAEHCRSPSAETTRKVMYLSTTFVFSVALANLALQYIYVSFAQMIGASTPLFTVAFMVVLQNKEYVLTVYIALFAICFGMMLCIGGEMNFHWLGFAATVAATVFRALKTVLQGMLLSDDGEKLDSLSLLFHMSKPSSALLTIMVLLFERSVFTNDALQSWGLWGWVFASSITAAFLNLSNFWVTYMTSALTLQVLGNLKGIIAIGVSVLIFHNTVTMVAMLGCCITLFGAWWYNKEKSKKTLPPETRALFWNAIKIGTILMAMLGCAAVTLSFKSETLGDDDPSIDNDATATSREPKLGCTLTGQQHIKQVLENFDCASSPSSSETHACAQKKSMLCAKAGSQGCIATCIVLSGLCDHFPDPPPHEDQAISFSWSFARKACDNHQK